MKLSSVDGQVRALVAGFRDVFPRMLAVAILTIVTLGAGLALAQPLSVAQTSEAEQLGEQGVAAYEAQQYQIAREHLEKAYDISNWGTIGVWLARTYAKLGLRTEAFRVFSDVVSAEKAPDEATPFQTARQEAKQAADKLALELGIVQFKSSRPMSQLNATVDGGRVLLDREHRVALPPGEHTLAVTWAGGRLASTTVTAVAGRITEIELDGEGPRVESARGTVASPSHNLQLTHVDANGWTLNDADGNVICTLPCRWSGTDPQSLNLRHEDLVLPIRLAKADKHPSNIEVRVLPKRGSKGWALGLGITSGVLTLGSLQAASVSGYSEQGAYVAGAAFFGAGFAACVWWYLWSKSRPYLDYRALTDEELSTADTSVNIEWLGRGLRLRAAF